MAVIRRFEDILSWQKARNLTNSIYKETSVGAFSKDYSLRDQIRRAATSIMLNIAEGFGRRTDKEFKQFLVQAHGSCAEIQPRFISPWIRNIFLSNYFSLYIILLMKYQE